ncbi:trigger factor [Helicobacter zhangjianzhongii]|uniref:trigger factor n=1 Tax=Helicobacter zhangjianzhongii TaxID=2974574 RepID=UPI002556BE59|nr:trigger factor [Helicobacter sp. CPD2-1]MDL0080116.1 trigger factor [Helicobacter sp. CPD2-1]
MNLQTSKTNTANAIAKGKIALQDLEKKLESIAQKASKTLKIAGFRPGKVPVQVVKSRYKDSLEKDAQKELVQDMLSNALKELQLTPQQLIGDPIITKFDKGAEAIEVEIAISLIPEFSLEALESKIPTPKIPTPEKKDIQERLDMMAQSQGELVESKDKAVKKDHIVNIDFEGFVDGVAFEGGKAEGFDLTIGSGQFIPGFEDALIGVKNGEEKSIEVNFPENYHSSALAGKLATFKVKINKIQERVKCAIDDVLATKILGRDDATLAELESRMKDELALEMKNRHYNDEMKQKCLEALDSGFSFDLPDAIVEQEMDVLFRNALSTIAPDELKDYQQDVQKAKDKRESFRDEACKSVKITFIVDAIAKAKGITINDNEVMQAIYYESMMQGQNPKEVLEYYRENGLIPAVKMAMIEDRVLHHLLDEKAGLLDKKAKATKVDSSQADSKKADSTKVDSSANEGKSPAKATKPKTTKKTPKA